MPDCTDRNEQIMLDVYGDLDPGARSAWEDHLRTCADCRRERENLTALLGRVREAMAPPPLSMRDSSSMVRNVQKRLAGLHLPGGWRHSSKRKRTSWIPALSTACLLVLAAIFVDHERSGTIDQPVAQRVDNPQISPEDENEIINNLDLLKDLDTLEKLSQLVKEAADRNPSDTNNQGTQGNSRYDQDMRFA